MVTEEVQLHTLPSVLMMEMYLSQEMIITLNNYLNHLYWLNNGKPNGNIVLKKEYDLSFDKIYTKFLKEAKMTDTLYCIAKI